MDRREELGKIIKDNLEVPFPGRLYTYPNISDKGMAQASKNFDTHLNTTKVVAFFDPTYTANGRNGMVFTLAGVYYRYFASKPFYFNYEDIKYIEVVPDWLFKKTNTTSAELKIHFNNGTLLTIGYGDFQKENLKSVLLKLKAKAATYDDVVSLHETGEIKKPALTPDQIVACNGIIHSASLAAGGVGAGLAQLPLADAALITPIQIAMITSIGAVMNIEVTEAIAKAIIGGAGMAVAGRGLVQLAVGWIPGVGNAINTATAAGLTEIIGWIAVAHFFDQEQGHKARYKVDGMKQGYNDAAEEYEAKLRKQAKEFFEQKKVIEKEFESYEALLSEYTKYIEKLEAQIASLQASGLTTQNISDKVVILKKERAELQSLSG